MTLSSSEIGLIIGGVMTILGAIGGGLWKGLVKITDAAKEIMAKSDATITAIASRYDESMRRQNDAAIQTAVAMKDQADANRQLADAVTKIGERLEKVEDVVGEHDRAITGKFKRVG